MIEQLALIIFGIVVGSVLGVEYSMWKGGRKLRFLEELVGFDRNHYKTLTLPEKRKYIGSLLKTVLENIFPEMPRPSIPSRITTLSGNEFFVPTCPQCGHAAAPVTSEPGAMVKAFCPKHGVFAVQIPDAPEEKKEGK